MIKENLNLSEKEKKQILIGSLLGDGSISYQKKNNCYRYSETHCSKQKDYLIWKNNILSFNFRFDKKENQYKIQKGNKELKYYYNLFYKNGKKIVSKEILDMLNPLGIAIWICDDGSFLYGNNNIRIATLCFSLEEHNLIKIYFKEKWGLECTFAKINRTEGKFINGKAIKTTIPVQYYTHFNVLGTKKLIEIIKPYIIPLMEYKIGLDSKRIEHAMKRKKEYNKIYNPQYHLNNREKELKRSKKYHQRYKDNPEFKLKNKERTKKWAKENPEKVKEWREKNKEKIREYSREYMKGYNKNPEILKKIKIYRKVYYQNNKEKIRKIQREWKNKNIEKVRGYKRKYKEKQKILNKEKLE